LIDLGVAKLPSGEVGIGAIMAINENEQTKDAITGKSAKGRGVVGQSDQTNGIVGSTSAPNAAGVRGVNREKQGPVGRGGSSAIVESKTYNPCGVLGIYDGRAYGTGVTGDSYSGDGVAGTSERGIGVRGDSVSGFAAVHGNGGKNGVWGYSTSSNDSGVYGSNDGSGNGVAGFSKAGVGVHGKTNASDQNAIFGMNAGSETVSEGLGRPAGSGVWGHTEAEGGSGVVGSVKAGLTEAVGVTGIGTIAGKFFGDVVVTGDIQLTGADLAEHFDVVDPFAVEPGMVMVLDPGGGVRACDSAYDTRVAGVVSGAGHYKPGVVLDRQSDSGQERQPLALAGKVYCKVDARYGPVDVGDLLTTSSTVGHAMKATDPARAFGAVLGKAMGSLTTGVGLLPVLVSLR
jgi:hypothetical protein